MTGLHHPTDATLARYAAGTLERGLALVVAAHLETCGRCRDHVRSFEAVGGEILSGLPMAEMAPDSFARVLNRLEEVPRSEHHPPMPARPRNSLDWPEGVRLPGALNRCDIGRWRWGAPGFRWSRVGIPDDRTANVILLRVAAGRKMPRHGHTGIELNLVLKGSFSDEAGRYGPGDLCEADEEVEHRPIVDPQGECICLAALEGHVRLQGFFGRLVQPIVGV